MLIKEIMTKNPEYLPANTLLKKAAEEMLKHDFGFLPVGENGKLVGVVTDRDLAIRAVAKGLEPKSASLKEVMTKSVISCHENDDVHAAAKLMESKQIRRLVVLDKNEHISGVISLGDIATKCHEINLNDEVIRAVSEKSH